MEYQKRTADIESAVQLLLRSRPAGLRIQAAQQVATSPDGRSGGYTPCLTAQPDRVLRDSGCRGIGSLAGASHRAFTERTLRNYYSCFLSRLHEATRLLRVAQLFIGHERQWRRP